MLSDSSHPLSPILLFFHCPPLSRYRERRTVLFGGLGEAKVLAEMSNIAPPSKHYCFVPRPILLRLVTYIGRIAEQYRFVGEGQGFWELFLRRRGLFRLLPPSFHREMGSSSS